MHERRGCRGITRLSGVGLRWPPETCPAMSPGLEGTHVGLQKRQLNRFAREGRSSLGRARYKWIITSRVSLHPVYRTLHYVPCIRWPSARDCAHRVSANLQLEDSVVSL